MESVYLTFILILAIFLGFELISRVPSTLHTPLMSGTNAISGVILVGALASMQTTQYGFAVSHKGFSVFLSVLAIIFATINVVGGYTVTERMLAMFRKKNTEDK